MANKKYLRAYIIHGGRRYENSDTIMKDFEISLKYLRKARKNGLRYVLQDGNYYYNAEDVMAYKIILLIQLL